MEFSKPKFVFTVFRHGARAPIPIIDGVDLLGNKWDLPEGQLTEKGKMMHFELGRRLKTQYDHLISKDSILTMSTDYQRTKESLKFHLQGMFEDQPTEIEVFNKTDIIPNDSIKFEAYHHSKVKPECYAQPNEEFKEYILYFKENCAKHYNKWLPEECEVAKDEISCFQWLTNQFTCCLAEGKGLDKFTNLEDRLKECEENFIQYYLNCYVTSVPGFIEANNTELIKKLFEVFEKKEESGITYFTFSAHDITILLLNKALNNLFGTKLCYPNFSNYLAFEFYENEEVVVVFNGNELLREKYELIKEKFESTYSDPLLFKQFYKESININL